ncbi:glycosyl hydrolase [Novosphingobium sp. KACC 22771]|uniref:glycosyl hydrolase n=1 Tax=Novosphingobium sp. KACC 22771 TaxID=3025670 RepID=UPI002366C973|nr:glycosyl hydrolase [Novosphingobium sp. KACC 22771]WDF74359.1 glycosyl hydrolase [Novosphingobium sp. KACC 22771]
MKTAASAAALALALASTALTGPALAQTAPADPLGQGFQTPPDSARPRVWWHWMNGNISQDGIAKDLEWMRSIGIAGAQAFDVNINTPLIVPKRIGYMTPEWKEAFHFAAQKADSLNMELAIAASPGWSETGGPWVKPEDGMKKIVWSETEVTGGGKNALRLPDLPSVSGPYQNMPRGGAFAGTDKGMGFGTAHGDIGIYAYRLKAAALPLPKLTQNGEEIGDAALLADGRLDTRLPAASGTATEPGALDITFDKPQTVRSVTLYIANLVFPFTEPALLPRLEVREGDGWRSLGEAHLTTAATTIGFPAVTAREFRLVFAENTARDTSGSFVMKHPARVQLAELHLSGDAAVDHFEAKSGLAVVSNYYQLDHKADAQESGLAPTDIVDLTGKLRPDGTLDWQVPKGQWRIVRMGWSLTGTVNHPANPEATGLEVDKYDGAAVRRYLETYLGNYRAAAGDSLMGAHGVRAIVTDSTEIGTANWTPRAVEQFKALRGYDPTPWLPTLAGVLIGTRAQSDAFLYDWRRTLADLQASQHYGTVAKVAHEKGLKVYGEALENERPILGDDMSMRSHADVPMAAIWTYPLDKGPAPGYLADMKGAASVAHVYGQNLAASETFTSSMQFWAHAPADLKPVADLAFAYGINRPIIHTSVHQPVDDKVPGLSLSLFGQFFTRHESWATMAKPWIDYLSRSGYLLQQGRNVADVAYFYGEEQPLTALFAKGPASDAPKTHAYDFLSADALLDQTSVDKGEVITKGGARYAAIYLGGSSSRMTLPVLRKLAALVEDGGTVIGKAPLSSPSLKDDPAEFAALTAKLWGGKLGLGRVIASDKVEQALADIGVAPAFAHNGAADSQILFVQRHVEDGEIFYLTNRLNRRETIEARFRVTGKAPWLWHAETGQSEPLSYRTEGGATIVPLDLAPRDAAFVVFRQTATAPALTVAPTTPSEVASLDKGWSVSFQSQRGAPDGSITLPALSPLNTSTDPRIRYFSGVATYRTSFAAPKGQRGKLWLDLGTVGDLAEVSVNGKPVGAVWHAPYRLDIGDAIKRGTNSIEVKVANLWVNRLIGDAQPDVAQKITWTSQKTYGAAAPLRASGLIGPVKLYSEVPVK